MKIGAYQFAVTANVQDNLTIMKKTITDAVSRNVVKPFLPHYLINPAIRWPN